MCIDMKLIHIVPRFRPQFDGLGDYARLLGDYLLSDHGIESRYLVGDPEWPGLAQEHSDHDVSAVTRRDAASLAAQVEDSEIVVLHYVGYGYQSRGIPFWINEGIRRWLGGDAARKLIVVFHELWASGPPWKSECYLGFIQRRLVSDLYRMADLSIVSGPLAQRSLEAFGCRRIMLHYVPSGISNDEAERRSWASRCNIKVALFGMLSQRELSLRSHAHLLMALESADLLGGVNVIGQGARDGDSPSREVRALRNIIPRSKIHVLPDATSEEIGRMLASSDIMLSFYPSRWLGKSGSVMAALANGVVPILREGVDLSFLRDGVEVIVCSGDQVSIDKTISLIRSGALERMGRDGRGWYLRQVDWPILANRLSRALFALQRSGEFSSKTSGRQIGEFQTEGVLDEN